MFLPVSRALPVAVATSLLLLLAACGGGGASSSIGAQVSVAVSTSQPSVLSADDPVAGVTPFISFVTLHGSALKSVASVNFVIAARSGSSSKPVSVTYSLAYLTRRGYASAGAATLQVPVFGLYAGQDNGVAINLVFSDASTYSLPLTITTAPWTDPHALYDHPTIVQARAPGSALGFDFLYMKSQYGSPVVIDTDAQVRWVGPDVAETLSSHFTDGGFVLGGFSTPDIYRLEFDGTNSVTGSLAASGVQEFSHDIEDGKTALLNNVDGTFDGVFQFDSTAQEFTADGTVLATWDMARIVSAAMVAGGDDPTLFVRPGVDWFHLNTAVYDPSDDSVILSSRENFVIKVDYLTGAIRWIFGDTTKYWYTFPSLRAKALALVGDGVAPIGQHSVAIAPDGSLLMFNDGAPSTNQPVGAPTGASRAYSTVSDYTVDPVAMTVTNNWNFDYGQSLLSAYCSSARQVAEGSTLVDYSFAAGGTQAHIVGLDKDRNVAFDIQYPTTGCATAWNAQPLALDALTFTK